jgi:chaperonin GroES
MKVRPLHDRILVKRIEDESRSKGGIIIPDTAKEKPQEGKVIAVGKGRVDDEGKLLPLDVQKGDRILFGKYSGSIRAPRSSSTVKSTSSSARTTS